MTESLESKCTTEDGRVCQLPFTFRGTQYTECTMEHDQDGRLWCSTRTDHLGHHVQNGGHWGHCQDSCLSGQGQTLADNEISQKLESKRRLSLTFHLSVCIPQIRNLGPPGQSGAPVLKPAVEERGFGKFNFA